MFPRVLSLVTALLLACQVAPAWAGNALLQVRATVLERARLQLVTQPATLQLTAADVARGYVDVPEPTRVQLESNMRKPVQLDFTAGAGAVRAGGVELLDGPARMQPVVGRQQVELRFRLHLDRDAVPGVHAWPVQISMLPL